MKQTVEGFFYHQRDAITRSAALKILGLIDAKFGRAQTVVDVGCGVGTWLATANGLWGANLQGIEGPWIGEVSLVVDRSVIRVQDLEQNWELHAEYDLGICLEVAEHLTPPAGAKLVRNLAQKCRLILFSAAIPGQGGNGHINEQWPAYWQSEFAQYDMEGIDLLRPLIWDDETIPWWYRQNVVVFACVPIAQRYFERLARDRTYRTIRFPPLRIQPV